MSAMCLQFQRLLRPIFFAMAMVLSVSASACYVNIAGPNGSASRDTVCSGGSITITGVIIDASYQVNYQWKKNGVAITGTGSSGSFGANPPHTVAGNGTFTYTFTGLVAGDKITCFISEPYANNYTYTSNTLNITVPSNVTPSVAVSASPTGSICFGTSVAFTAIPTNGGTAPSYQWKKNGNNVGTNSTHYTDATLNNNDVVSCTLTPGSICVSPATATGSYTAVVNSVTPSVAIAGASSSCSGTSVTFTATPTNGGTAPTYQWKKNGTTISGATNSTYTTSSLVNGDAISCTMTSNAACATTTTANSNTITETVTTSVTPSVSITSTNGASSICANTSVTFTATPTNGGTPTYQWQKNNSPISGATGSTYTASGFSNGDVITVVMTSTAACATPSTTTSNGITMTVNPTVTPSVSITGTATPCANASVTFRATPTNGGTPTYQWQKNGSAISGATSSTYAASSLNTGDVIAVVMMSTATCATPNPVTSNTITETVTPTVTPSVAITGNATRCANASVTFTATPTNGGTPTYQWQKNGSAISGATGSTYNASGLSTGDAITVVMTSTATCATPNPVTSNTITETVTPNVIPSVAITGNATPCANASVTFTATPTNGGTPTYQWQKNGSAISGATSSTYNASGLSTGDVIAVMMTSTATCAAPTTATSNNITMTVTPNVTPSVSISGNTITCANASVTFIATPTNGGTPTYQWQKNGAAISGATNSTYTASLNNGDAITVVMASTATCATPNPVTSNTITETVTPNVTPSVSITGNATPCANASVTFTATPTNGGTPTYQWKKNGSAIIGATSSTYTGSGFSTGDVIAVIMTSTATCAAPTTATSNSITMNVTPNVTPSVSVSGNTATCAGSPLTFTANPTNGGTPSYQWQKNGTAISGATGNTYTSSSLSNGDAISVVMTSTAACATTNTATSSGVTVSITPTGTPSVVISGNATPCAGASVTFTATPTNGGTPSYQWQKNGSSISGATGSSYTTSALSNGDVITVVMTSTATCASPTTATSNGITITPTADVTPSVSISGSATSCANAPVTFTATPTNGGSPTYQWQNNGVAISGATSSTYSSSSLSNGDAIRVVMTSTAACTTANPVTSNTISETVTTNVTPSVSIAGSTTSCAGSPVTFTATPTNGGTPTYQWQKNGSAISGATGSTYTGALNNNDVISLVMTSTASCTTMNPVTSNTITEIVTPTVTPSVSISGSAATCSGTPVTFTATPTNGGTPTYQWKKNGTAIAGATNSTYADASLNNNDAITVVMTSTASCATTNPVTSNTITETVTPSVAPSVSITGNATSCANTSVTFTATPTNGGTPTYQWQKNGSAISSATGSTYSSSSLSNNDVISVVMTSTASCATANPVTSNTITETVTPTVTPSVSIAGSATTCSGTSVTFTATPTNGGTPTYQWQVNGSSVSGATRRTYTDAALNNNDAITVVMTSTAACTTVNPVTSNTITETVTTSVTPSVSISGNTTPCANASVTFTATPTNGGTPTYQWQKNNSPINGATGATYTTNNLSTNDAISVVMASSLTCTNVNPVTSNTITETITPNVTPSVSITSNQGATTCAGASVTFTATPTNGGTPTYQWTNNGNAINGATSSTYTTTTLNNNDQVAVVMTSTASCVTTTPATSNTITEIITPVVTPSVSISGNSSTCANTPVTFTATANNGGSSSAYQWKKNGNAISGATGNTYTDAGLNNNDVITAVMTGNAACANNAPVTSNAITESVNGTAAQPGAFTVSSSTTYDGQTGVVYTVPNVPGTTYTWAYSGTDATINGSGNSVTLNFDAEATSGTLSVTATTSACASPSAAQSINITVKPFITWTCGANTDWNNAANWDGGFVPTSIVSVYIPSNTPCQPNICSAPASAYNVMVGVGSTVNICCSNTLTVNNDLTVDGAILGCGKVTMTDTTCHIVYGSGRVDNFELNNSCGGMINPGDTLHIGNTYIPTNGVMTIGGELELLSDSTVTASIVTHPGACSTYMVGDVICDKYIHGGRRAFRFLGHPFSTSIPLSQLEYSFDITGQGGAANGFTTTVTNNPSAFWYNTLTGNGSTVNDSTGWIPFTNTDGQGANAWKQFEGIRLFMRGSKGQGLGCGVCVPDAITIKMHGPINGCSETVTTSVNNNAGFNFIANPYPSAIDLSQIARGNAIGANFNVWDPNQGLVGAYVEQPFSMAYVLPAYSAFFATSNNNADKTITFHETDKTTAAPTGNLFKTTGATEMVQLHILSNNDSLSWDRLLLFFNDQAQAGIDDADGIKLQNPDLSFYTYSTTNDQLAIDQRPYVNGQVIKLGLVTDVNQSYAIRVDDYNVPAGGSLYLHDKYLNKTQLLTQGMHYNFSVTTDAGSQGDNRFELNTVGSTGVANVANAAELKVDMFPNPVIDNATISYNAPQRGNTMVIVSNLLGQEVYVNELGQQQTGKVNLPLSTLPGGIYMVTFKCGDLSVTKRLVKQ